MAADFRYSGRVISPGHCGMVIDANSKTTSLNGNTVSSRIIIPCSGIGVYQSLDGGATFSKITADATTPPTRFTYTTTHDDSIIVLQIYCYQQGSVRNVTSTGPSPVTWQHRAGPLTPNSYNFGNLFEYWAHAPSGTYEISVNYNDGNNAAILGHQVGNYSSVVDGPPAATFTAAISNTGTTGVGAVVNVTRVLTGTLTLGQVIQGGRSSKRKSCLSHCQAG